MTPTPMRPTEPPATRASRPALLALHCSGAGGRVFSLYRERLARDTPLIAPDLLGSGAEPAWPLGAALDLDQEAARLEPLLDRPGGVHLLGHSYGGAVALQLAWRRPERVRSLTLYEPARFRLLDGDGDPATWSEIVAVGRGIGARVQAGAPDAAARRFVDYWSGAGTWDALPAGRQAGVAGRMAKVQAEFEALFADPLPPGAFSALRVPTVVIAGDRSPAPARRVAERLARLIPGARRVVLPGRGHMGALEDPDAVCAWLPDGVRAPTRAARAAPAAVAPAHACAVAA